VTARRSRFASLIQRLAGAAALAAATATAAAQVPDPRAQELLARAVAAYRDGRAAEAAATFDDLVRLAPDAEPYLWQRGIALYHAGRYRDCRAQFESHRTVNPDDVENAAWHFLCVARQESPEAARAALLPVGPDPRRPMREIYQMFRGALAPEAVLAAAGAQTEARFYAHLYVGLYADAIGDRASAREHVAAAAADRFLGAGGYMHIVARVHLAGMP
jgi:tetratricopeptide (TPR) repeat protein